jgi:hypothetical protein
MLKRRYPTSDEIPPTRAISVHMARIRRGLHPLIAKPTVDESASGTLETKTAARYAAPTAPLS